MRILTIFSPRLTTNVTRLFKGFWKALRPGLLKAQGFGERLCLFGKIAQEFKLFGRPILGH
jgi:hypothetical protein